MIVLRLVRRPDGAAPGPDARPIKAGGSTIGRAHDCDLVLDDPLRLVSRRHAWIVPQGADEALLRCISTTATLMVNGEPLPPGGERTVHHGDRLRIFGFEVLVEASESEVTALPPPAAAPAQATPPMPMPMPMPAPAPAATPVESAVLPRRSRLDQWFDLDTVADPLGPGSPLPAPDGAVVAKLARSPARDPVLAPSPAVAPGEAAPWADSGATLRKPLPMAMPERNRHAEAARASPPAAAPVEVELPLDEIEALRLALLRGARLEPSNPLRLSPALMEHVGTLLRTMTEGTLDLLRSRAVAKRGIRAEGTRIVPRENNPLKFAPDAIEALRLLLNEHSRPGFLDPVDALRDAHGDLQVHQLAMIAGMRAAVFELISRLGPESIEAAEGPARGLARRFPVLRDAALWRRQQQSHAHLLANLDDAFEAAFGREFLLAYEAQSARVSEAPSDERTLRPDRNAGF